MGDTDFTPSISEIADTVASSILLPLPSAQVCQRASPYDRPDTGVTMTLRSSPVFSKELARKLCALVTSESMTVTLTAPMTIANTVRVVLSFCLRRLRIPVRN